MRLGIFTKEEMDMIALYADGDKKALLENLNTALVYMDTEVKHLVEGIIQKMQTLTEDDYVELMAYACEKTDFFS